MHALPSPVHCTFVDQAKISCPSMSSIRDTFCDISKVESIGSSIASQWRLHNGIRVAVVVVIKLAMVDLPMALSSSVVRWVVMVVMTRLPGVTLLIIGVVNFLGH